MENYLFALLLSVFVLVVAFYVEQRRIQIKDELLQHGNEIKKVEELLMFQLTRNAFITQVKEELGWTRQELKQVKVVLQSTRKELKQVHVELESTRNEPKQEEEEWESMRNELKQVKVELESTRKELKHVTMVAREYVSKTSDIDYLYHLLKKQMIEQYVRREEIDQIIADVNALREELNETKKGAPKEDQDWQSQFLEKGEKEKELGNVNVKLGGAPKEDHDLQSQLLEEGEKEKELGNIWMADHSIERIVARYPHPVPTDHRKLPIVVSSPHTKLPVFGKHYWRVSEKVPGYGADLTLFCFVDDCCCRSAGWIKWNPNYKTIYLDVRNFKGTVSSKDKYATTYNKTGFSLVIKNLQEDDLYIIYACSYGFKNSLGKLLHHSEVFKDETTTTHFADERTTTNFKDETSISHFKEVTDETATDLNTNSYYSESENNSKSVKIIIGVLGAALVILVAIAILIVKFQQRRRLASRNKRKSSEEGQDSQNQLLAKGEKDEELANENTKLGESSEEGQDAQNQLLAKGEKEEELANGNTKLGESSEEGQDAQNQLLAKGEKEEEFANGNTKLGGSSEEGQDMQNQLLTKEKK